MALGEPDTQAWSDGWTLDDLERLEREFPEGYRYEMADGVLEVSPPPSIGHETIAELLMDQIAPQLGPEWRVSLARAVRTGSGFRLPDALVRAVPGVSAPSAHVREPVDVPLVIEVESPTSLDRDRSTKTTEYAEVGIPAYWRVERHPRLVVVVHVLEATGYREVARLTSGRQLVPGPLDVVLDLDALRAASGAP